MARRPGVPTLLREINDRAALELLLSAGPLTRADLGELTGLSKVTASQLLSRLEARGLVEVVGARLGGRGPNAALYGVVPSSGYVAGLDVGPDTVITAIADITGEVIAEVQVDPNGSDDPARTVHRAVAKATRTAKVSPSRLAAAVIGTPGVVDPRTGDVRFSFDLPSWHEGVLQALRGDLRCPVTIENDVNLAAVAEREHGAARDAPDFGLMWVGRGLGLATVIGGRLHRGNSGAAGEIGWLPVPGAPMPETVAEPRSGSLPTIGGAFQSLVGADAVRRLAAESGFASASEAAGAEELVRSAVAAASPSPATSSPSGASSPPAASAAEEFIAELALRLAVGVASISVVLDPGLVVVSGDIGRAGGAELARRIETAVGRMCPNPPSVAVSTVQGAPVLRGALLAALDQAREIVFAGSPGA